MNRVKSPAKNPSQALAHLMLNRSALYAAMLIAGCIAWSPAAAAEGPRVIHYRDELAQASAVPLMEAAPKAQAPRPAERVTPLTGLSVSTIPPEDVARISLTGTSPHAARADHMHQGVRSLRSKDGEALYEDVILDAGKNVTLQQAGNTLIIGAAGGGDITGVKAGDGLIGGGLSEEVLISIGAGPGLIATSEELKVDLGTGPNQVVQLNGQGKLPAVDGSFLKELNASSISQGTLPDKRLAPEVSRLGESIESEEITDGSLNARDTSEQFLKAGVGVVVEQTRDSWIIEAVGAGGDITAVEAGAGLIGGSTSGAAVLSVKAGKGLVASKDGLRVDVGKSPNQIVQLDEEGRLPALDGSKLTQLSAGSLSEGTIPDARLAAEISRLGASISSDELEKGTIQSKHLAESSVGAEALSPKAIQPGDIEPGDLPGHASHHHPEGSDALPTAAAVSVGEANEEGVSRDFSRSDHAHEGIRSLKASGEPAILGDAVLAAGGRITLEQKGNTITIDAKGPGAPGVRLSETASDPVLIQPGQVTELMSLRLTKSQTTSAVLIMATVQLAHRGGAAEKTVDLQLLRDDQPIGEPYRVRLGRSGEAIAEIPITIQGWDTSGKGTRTFALSAKASGAGSEALQRRLSAIELF